MDLSKVTMDNPPSLTPAGDTIFEETDNSTQSERDPKDDGVVLTQPVVEKLVTPLIPSNKTQEAKNPSTQDTQVPPPKDNVNPQDTPTTLD